MIDKHLKAVLIIRDCAAKFIQQEANTDPLITVTGADASPDFKNVTICITTIPDGKEKDALLFLKRSAREFRDYLKKHARLRVIPHVTFMVDFGERHRQYIDEIVRETGADKKE
jgi:ribosome-binding factor A